MKANAKLKQEEFTRIGYARELDIKALLELMGMVSKSNGRVAESQIHEVEQFMSCQVPSSERAFAISSFRKGKELAPTKSVVTSRAFQLYGYQEEDSTERWLEPIQVLDILLRVAFADGEYSDEEDYIIDGVRATLGVHKRSFWILRDTLAPRYGVKFGKDWSSFANRIKHESKSSHSRKGSESNKKVKSKILGKQEALSRLGLKEGAGIQQIKNSHRKLIKQFHPDLMGAEKESEEVVRHAIERFREIQEAYEALV